MPEIFKVEGGRKLSGTVRIKGAKNSALPILAASLMADGKVCIENCPDLSDVRHAIEILEYLGCDVSKNGSTVCVDPGRMSRCDIPHDLMKKMRSSVIFLGAVLSKMGKAHLSYPGGCELGPRPIDLHIDSLKKMGVRFTKESGEFFASAPDGISGADISLSFPSVGATENIMLASAVSKGTTTVSNAAKEPEIEDLADFLNSMGAEISGAGTGFMTIVGKKNLKGTVHRVIPDRIAASTFLAAAAITGGETQLEGVRPGHMRAVTSLMRETGCTVIEKSSSIYLNAPNRLRGANIVRTMPYPGFPSDFQSIMMSLMTSAKGTSLFIETIFENRYRHVCELAKMGADIRVNGRVAVVNGVERLSGARVSATDLRGGAALIIAALKADGTSEIDELCHVDRGYEYIERDLRSMGARIERITTK